MEFRPKSLIVIAVSPVMSSDIFTSAADALIATLMESRTMAFSSLRTPVAASSTDCSSPYLAISDIFKNTLRTGLLLVSGLLKRSVIMPRGAGINISLFTFARALFSYESPFRRPSENVLANIRTEIAMVTHRKTAKTLELMGLSITRDSSRPLLVIASSKLILLWPFIFIKSRNYQYEHQTDGKIIDQFGPEFEPANALRRPDQSGG